MSQPSSRPGGRPGPKSPDGPEGDTPAHRVHLCGGFELYDASGRPQDDVNRQPKRALLLAYLLLTSMGKGARRDSVMALFWPEADESGARHALRQSLYFLRRRLADGIIESVGSEELRMNLGRVWCDVHEIHRALPAGRARDAHALYRGDLLEGLHSDGTAPELDRVIDEWRARLRERMAEAAWSLAESAARARDPRDVHHWGRRAVELSREVETAYRRLIFLFDRIGDVGAAVEAYRELLRRLRDDLQVEPSRETMRMIERVRGRLMGDARNDPLRATQAARRPLRPGPSPLHRPGSASPG